MERLTEENIHDAELYETDGVEFEIWEYNGFLIRIDIERNDEDGEVLIERDFDSQEEVEMDEDEYKSEKLQEADEMLSEVYVKLREIIRTTSSAEQFSDESPISDDLTRIAEWITDIQQKIMDQTK